MGNSKTNQTIFTNAKIVPMSGNSDDFEIIEDAVIVSDGDIIAWVGPEKNIPPKFKKFKEFNVKGKLITPGFIDCHTHLVFGGNRSTEFNMRLNGKSYEEIAKAGGGIASTMKSTRNATFDELLKSSLTLFDVMIRNGVTTVELNSGYGLYIET